MLQQQGWVVFTEVCVANKAEDVYQLALYITSLLNPVQERIKPIHVSNPMGPNGLGRRHDWATWRCQQETGIATEVRGNSSPLLIWLRGPPWRLTGHPRKADPYFNATWFTLMEDLCAAQKLPYLIEEKVMRESKKIPFFKGSKIKRIKRIEYLFRALWYGPNISYQE